MIAIVLYCICVWCKRRQKLIFQSNRELNNQSARTVMLEASKPGSLNIDKPAKGKTLINAVNKNASDEENSEYYMSLQRSTACANFAISGVSSTYYCIKHSGTSEHISLQDSKNTLSQNQLPKNLSNGDNQTLNNSSYHHIVPVVHHHHHSPIPIVDRRRICTGNKVIPSPEHQVVQYYNLETGTTVTQLVSETPFCRCFECLNREKIINNGQEKNVSTETHYFHHYGIMAPKSSATSSMLSLPLLCCNKNDIRKNHQQHRFVENLPIKIYRNDDTCNTQSSICQRQKNVTAPPPSEARFNL